MGRAGQSRARLLTAHPDCTLVSTVSRRAGYGTSTVEEVFSSAKIHAVVVATENATHPQLVADALVSGKHVLVEYPLAHRVQQIRELYDLARRQRRVLHLEMIGLLTASHAAVQGWLLNQAIARITLDFQGGFYRWVEDEAKAGRWGQLAVARLHALYQWCGPLSLQGGEFSETDDGYELQVSFSTGTGVEITLRDRRHRAHSRRRETRFWDIHDVEHAPPKASPSVDLFRRDLDICLEQIWGTRRDGYVSEAEAMEVTKLAEEVSALCVTARLAPRSRPIDNADENR